MELTDQIEINKPLNGTTVYSFPETPFENIGFALSGGGFRAATFGLGVLSILHHIKLIDNGSETNLLEKVRFVSSASGGTIPLAVYVASMHNQIPFADFYQHLNNQMTGEAIVEKAIGILNDQSLWEKDGKSRNIINAFARCYHDTLFGDIPESGKMLEGIMDGNSKQNHKVHIEEFCFNSTDFYSGISFRFQGRADWSGANGGTFGNAHIGIDFKKKDEAVQALKKIRLSDILAASSCFPLGFEPIVFPKDFTYPGGPSVKELKDAMSLETLSWDDKKEDLENLKSKRAEKEKQFAKEKTFGLMDGGICDNQGLHSLLLANERGNDHRFDLMMVSDVTSFYMSPYNVPEIKTNKKWMQKTPADYWETLRKIFKRTENGMSAILWISILVAIGFTLPLILEGISVASIILAVTGVLILITGITINYKFKTFLNKNIIIKNSLRQPTLQDLARFHIPKESFTRRTAIKLVNYLQSIQTGVLLQMINARAQSSAIMIGDVFLKHIRRLIYDQLFSNPRYVYRRLNNAIYKLTYTNNKNRSLPAFEPRENEDKESYNNRKAAFVEQVNENCLLTPEMQKTAEVAYGTGTTMWFETEQEQAIENNRKALISTGQFTTCYNLMAYSLGLKHSRHFEKLDQKYQDRILGIIHQLKSLMEEFKKDPYYLYKLLDNDNF